MTNVIASNTGLSELLKKIDPADRVALDTEADSLHSYKEKLCLIQISVQSDVTLSDAERSRGTASSALLRDGKPALPTCGGYVAAPTSLGIPVRSGCEFIVFLLGNRDCEPVCHAVDPKE